MEDTNNNQDNDNIDIDHNDNNDISDTDSNDEDAYTLGGDNYTVYTMLDKDTFHRLKQNDTSIIDIEVALHFIYGSFFFNSVDWKEDGDYIASNAHLKSLRITHHDGRPNGLGMQGRNLTFRQQLQEFFSCIYRNNSIKHISFNSIYIDINDFWGVLIEGLSGHPSLDSLDISHGKLGSKGCEALGKVLEHTRCKLKDLRLSYCQLDDEGLGLLCDGLVGNSTKEIIP